MAAEEEDRVLERIAAALEELLVWTRATSHPVVARILGEEFGAGDKDASVRAKVYAMSDGKRSTREVSAALGGRPRFNTISGMHAKWRRMGLAAPVNPTSQRSPTRALFDLNDFGIDVEVPTSSTSKGDGNWKGDQEEANAA